ncbi:NAD-P-binding protein [Laetiporus sulphureus 93-53]|uniref:NAD-P-binding protein n=1 Tax=Laetiporus sulphureus 93-53 TaxID=1314785 RepID=A0A165GI70_9APHY|nr:NAD-P-binding protein [Laetiporus sulphureus 93-53]KZT10383.1 NAD-P-binding protein [Laetiporus sulphureus 93-53]
MGRTATCLIGARILSCTAATVASSRILLRSSNTIMLFFSKTFDPARDLPDLKGRVIIVTGGNGGIGYATIQHLARHGAKVYMATRSEDKGGAAIARLTKEGLAPGNGEVHWLKLDLSDPRLAKASAEEFMRKQERLDVLINNAAMPRSPYTKTHDGIQDIMMVNHLSPFVFTITLLPLLTKTASDPQTDVRIVNVSSNAMRFLRRGVRFRNADDFNDEHNGELSPDMARYARSKLATVLFTTQLQKRLDTLGLPIITMALHPGLVRTEGVQNDLARQPPVISHIASAVVYMSWATPSRGAYTSVFAAVSPLVREQEQLYKGAYLQPPGRLSAPPNEDARKPELAEELWNTTEEILRNNGLDVGSEGAQA